METEKVKNFDDLINIAAVSKTITVAGHDIKLKSLGYDEQSGMMDVIPDNIKESKKYDMLQKEILANAIVSIDGVVLTHENKVDLLSRAQTGFVNLMFAEYELLIGDQNKILEDVKKNILLVKKTP